MASERDRWCDFLEGVGRVVLVVKGGGNSVTGDPGFEPGLGCSLILVQRVGRCWLPFGSMPRSTNPSCFGLLVN